MVTENIRVQVDNVRLDPDTLRAGLVLKIDGRVETLFLQGTHREVLNLFKVNDLSRIIGREIIIARGSDDPSDQTKWKVRIPKE